MDTKKLKELSDELERVERRIKNLNKVAEIILDANNDGYKVDAGIRANAPKEMIKDLEKEVMSDIQLIEIDMNEARENGGFDLGSVLEKAMDKKKEAEEKLDSICPSAVIDLSEDEAIKVIEIFRGCLTRRKDEIVDEIKELSKNS